MIFVHRAYAGVTQIYVFSRRDDCIVDGFAQSLYVEWMSSEEPKPNTKLKIASVLFTAVGILCMVYGIKESGSLNSGGEPAASGLAAGLIVIGSLSLVIGCGCITFMIGRLLFSGGSKGN